MTQTIFFKSAEHRQRFVTAMQQIGKISDGRLDPEYAAAVYILTADLATWNKASACVSSDGIDFEAVLEEDYSAAYVALIHLAGNVFNGTIPCSPVELYRLDESNFRVAMEALLLRRDIHVDVFGGKWRESQRRQ